MSSRALRKAQKERERLAAQEEQEDDESDDDVPHRPKPSAFAALLHQDEGIGGEDDDDDNDEAEEADHQETPDESADGEHTALAAAPRQTASLSKRKKKKNKKNKSKGVESTTEPSAGVDDIEAALKTLSASPRPGQDASSSSAPAETSDYYGALAIDTTHLQVSTEMRRIFGKAAVEAERQIEAEQRAQRRGDQQDGVGLADAVAGRNSAFGPGLQAAIRKRNMFVQGKEEWPRAGSEGLTMDIIDKRTDGVVEYAFVHSTLYRSSQREFEVCAQTMDPRLMVNLLRFHPYHVSTLLQVSEIAKQERDHATAGDLLERALFSFGRALHSSFATAIAQGKARLDFRRPENRQFYIAAWRYIDNVGMRATWRTALEWARLLFALNPEEDPYEMKLVIDQFALRARQPQLFLNMVERGLFGAGPGQPPNISFSRALAKKQLIKDKKIADMAEDNLKSAIGTYPWIASRIFQLLDIAKVPPSIWGKSPPDALQALYTELYASQALDLWKNNAELLVNAASTLNEADYRTDDLPHRLISRSEARHVILLDKPALLTIVPRDFTTQLRDTADPLPPSDSIISYTATSSADLPSPSSRDPFTLVRDDPSAFIGEMAELHRVFEVLIPNFSDRLERRPGAGDGADRGLDEPLALTEADIAHALQRSNIPPQTLMGLLERLVLYRQALSDQPNQLVEGGSGASARIDEDGRVIIDGPLEGDDADEDHDRHDVHS